MCVCVRAFRRRPTGCTLSATVRLSLSVAPALPLSRQPLDLAHDTHAHAHARFFHAYTAKCGEEFRRKSRAEHHTPGHVAESEKAFRAQGFPGCVGCIDVVHVPWGMCPAGRVSHHVGKEGFPTLSHKVTCSHLRRMTHCESVRHLPFATDWRHAQLFIMPFAPFRLANARERCAWAWR